MVRSKVLREFDQEWGGGHRNFFRFISFLFHKLPILPPPPSPINLRSIAVRVEEDLELEGLTMIKKHVPTEIIKLKSGRLRVKAKSTRREGDAGSHQVGGCGVFFSVFFFFVKKR